MLEQQGDIMYNALMSFIVSIVITMFFFFGGCLQLGAYIARNSVQDIPVYVDGLMLNSWSLAVAAVLFMLIELRLHRGQTRESEYEGNSIAEHTVAQRAVRPAGGAAYFRTDDAGTQVSKPQAARPAKATQVTQPSSREHTPVATPPSLKQEKEKARADKPVEETPPSAPKKEEENSDLSFFKL